MSTMGADLPVRAGLCYLPGRWNTNSSWALNLDRRPETVLRRSGILSRSVRYRVVDLQDETELLASCTTSDLLDDLQATLGELRSRLPSTTPLFLAGYSLGASLACLAIASERFRNRFSGLVLLDGGLHPGTGGPISSTSDLVESPTWNARFRRAANDALRSDLAPDSYPPLLAAQARDADQLRYFLHGNVRWWPRRQLDEIARLAEDQGVQKRLSSVSMPCLGAYTGRPTQNSARCRQTLAAMRHAEVEELELDASWSHADVASHPQTPKLWEAVADWISRACGTLDNRDGTTSEPNRSES